MHGPAENTARCQYGFLFEAKGRGSHHGIHGPYGAFNFSSAGQGRQMSQSGGNSHCVHPPHQMADPLLVPEDVRKIRKFTAYIVIRDAQVVPILVPSCEDVETGAPAMDLSFVPSVSTVQ